MILAACASGNSLVLIALIICMTIIAVALFWAIVRTNQSDALYEPPTEEHKERLARSRTWSDR